MSCVTFTLKLTCRGVYEYVPVWLASRSAVSYGVDAALSMVPGYVVGCPSCGYCPTYDCVAGTVSVDGHAEVSCVVKASADLDECCVVTCVEAEVVVGVAGGCVWTISVNSEEANVSAERLVVTMRSPECEPSCAL